MIKVSLKGLVWLTGCVAIYLGFISQVRSERLKYQWNTSVLTLPEPEIPEKFSSEFEYEVPVGNSSERKVLRSPSRFYKEQYEEGWVFCLVEFRNDVNNGLTYWRRMEDRHHILKLTDLPEPDREPFTDGFASCVRALEQLRSHRYGDYNTLQRDLDIRAISTRAHIYLLLLMAWIAVPVAIAKLGNKKH